MMRRPATDLERIFRVGCAACAALLLAAAPAFGAGEAARVTAAVGSTESGGDTVGMRGGLEDGDDLETGKDGQCSLLVDQDALMEVCSGTALRLDRKGGDPKGPRVVTLDRGEIRMVVEPRVREERIEIHTPAAIATILGTVLHVSVDALGVTTVTSAANRVLVQSNDPTVKGETTIEAGEQVVIHPGEAPQKQPTRLTAQAVGGLGGCLIDFHAASLAADRGSAESKKVAAVVSEDIPDGLPPVEAAAEELPYVEPPVENDPDILTPVDTVSETILNAIDVPEAPPACGPLGGRGCL